MLKKLALVLRKNGNSECLKKAEHLETDTSQIINLNLRNLDLKPMDMSAISDVFEREKDNILNFITSISISYNNLIGDEGVHHIIKSLPLSVYEIRLVDCRIGNKVGSNILNLIKKRPHLNMICIVQNNFSDELKNSIQSFQKQQS